MKLHPNTHLYVSDVINHEFPGRIFQIVEILNSKRIKGKRFNVIARNYPINASTIQNKFKLKDGGEDYLIAARTVNKSLLMFCRRVDKY